MKIAFVGYQKQERYSIGSPKDEDKVLMELFKLKGLNIEQVVWNDPKINWQYYDLAVIKSPWDYHEKFTEFLNWLNHLQFLNINILNPYKIIRWNSDKHYLKEIEDVGLRVIPSAFFEKNSRPQLSDYFQRFNFQKLVIKPCVSASAKNTLIVTADNISERQEQLNGFLSEESYMVQPFIEEIRQGELSFIFFGNKYSHSVIKLPKAGDFRVQHFHGGMIRKCEPDAKQILAAQQYIDRFAAGCLYARVDGLILYDNFHLMELELIEPYLFLDSDPQAYQRYYDALIEIISGMRIKNASN